MVVFPNAKINIGLNITEKRPDGFHNIESCFYPVGWTDVLEILPAEVNSFKSDGIVIPGDPSDNLCSRAYRIISEDFTLPAVSIHLLKAVPIGAGLGGGSSDAAFAIKALNEMFSLGLSFEKQLDYARRIGSDCAFFLSNKAAYCYHKGDEFEEIDMQLSGKHIVLVNPGIHISTVEAYGGIKPRKPSEDLRELLKKPIVAWKDFVRNDFETTLFPKYPLLKKIKEQLYGLGATYASMSGSGSTIYGIFDREIDPKPYFDNFKIWKGILN